MSGSHPRMNREVRGFFSFSREMLSSFGLALVFIVYVVQAYRIPSGSMEDSLLIGDQLLGVKFAYGSPVYPFSRAKFPGIKKPAPGEVIIFDGPDNSGKDLIKRCVAGPGRVVRIDRGRLLVDGSPVELPPAGKLVSGGRQPFDEIEHFAPLRIPGRGDVIGTDTLGVRELLFLKHLIRQEHPNQDVRLDVQLYIDGAFANHRRIPTTGGGFTVDRLNRREVFDSLDNWVVLKRTLEGLRRTVKKWSGADSVLVLPRIERDGKYVRHYEVRHDNYFMLGDNRDNSLDSRYWGYLNETSIRAQACIIYFSMDPDVPFWNIARKFRWDRFGKLIRTRDGTAVPRG